jgi:glycosyltransferase involved in cell wall biosynthesis
VPQFLITNLFYSADITRDEHWQTTCAELRRDFPWILTERYNVCVSGIGQAWSGWRHREHFSSHAGFRSKSPASLNAALSWLTHFRDAVRLARKRTLIVVAPTPPAGFGAAFAKLLFRKRMRLVVRVQGHSASKALHVKHNKLKFRIVDRIERFVLQRADLVLSMGKFTTDLAISKGVNPKKALILPFPVAWAQRAEIVDLPLKPNILFVGRLEREKGVDCLLQAMVLLRKTVPAACLYIAGDGKHRSTFEKTANYLGISDKVVFVGWLDAERLRNTFSDSWLLVFPTIWEEGLGMVLVEAGLMGRPVIASEIGGVTDVVRQQENGLLVPPGNTEALADAIANVLSDRDSARAMGLAGDRIARQYLAGRDSAVEQVRQAILYQLDTEAP